MKVENLFNTENVVTLLQFFFFFPHSSLGQLLLTCLTKTMVKKELAYMHVVE